MKLRSKTNTDTKSFVAISYRTGDRIKPCKYALSYKTTNSLKTMRILVSYFRKSWSVDQLNIFAVKVTREVEHSRRNMRDYEQLTNEKNQNRCCQAAKRGLGANETAR